MQQKIKQLSLAVPTVALVMALVTAGPAMAARGGQGSSGQDPSGPPQNASELHAKGKAMVDQLRSQRKTQRTAEARQKICEAHKKGLQTRANNIVKAAQNFQSRIDTIYSEAETYQQTNNVTTDNWDALVAAADAAKTNSTDAVTALAAVEPSVDCNSTSVAQDVATFKVAATQARDDLKTYKADVKAVVQALETGKSGSTTNTTTDGTKTSDGGDQ